jgi:hypothetical protein
MFIYPIYYHNWRNISTIYIYTTRLASNEIFSPSNKILREVDQGVRTLTCWECGFDSRQSTDISLVVVLCVVRPSHCICLITNQRSPTKCGVSEYDRDVSIMWRPWPTRGCCAKEKISEDKFQPFSMQKDLFKYKTLCKINK